MGAGRARARTSKKARGGISSSSVILGRPERVVRLCASKKLSRRRAENVNRGPVVRLPTRRAYFTEARHRSAVAHGTGWTEESMASAPLLIALVRGKMGSRQTAASPPNSGPGKWSGMMLGMQTVPLVRRRDKTVVGRTGVRSATRENRMFRFGRWPGIVTAGRWRWRWDRNEQRHPRKYWCGVSNACGQVFVADCFWPARVRPGIRLSVRG